MLKLSSLLRLNLIICALITSCFWIPLWVRGRLAVDNVKGRAVCRILSISIAAGGMIAFLACFGRNTYYDTMMKDAEVEEADSRYLPFSEGNDLHTIDESTHLYLLKDLPVIEGDSTLLPFYASMIQMIYPESIMELEEEDCPFRYTQEGDLYYKLITGEVDMLFSAQEPSRLANEELKKRVLELEETVIGQVGFVFFVNSNNEVSNLTLSQIKSIYAGGVSNWKDLGGSDMEILAFQSDENSSVQKALQKLMGRLPLKENISIIEYSREEGLSETAISYTNVPGAIGCTFSCYAHGLNVDKGVKLLHVEGVCPCLEEEGWKSYCLMEPVYCVTVKSRETTNTKVIREWVLSTQGQRLLKAAGYYPLAD